MNVNVKVVWRGGVGWGCEDVGGERDQGGVGHFM